MKDRFKFRCWHEPTKTMYEVFDFNENFIRATPDLVVPSIRTLNTKDCVLMQCAGLKDVNGKLIYEGDIIKYMYYNPKRYTKWVVVFDQNTLEFGLKDYRYGGYLRITRHSILNNKVEIIGNKFQNPELLNEVENAQMQQTIDQLNHDCELYKDFVLEDVSNILED